MTKAEIVAWQLGLSIEAEVHFSVPAAAEPARLDWPALTVDQQEARWRLGDDLFAFWVLRGAADAIGIRGG